MTSEIIKPKTVANKENAPVATKRKALGQIVDNGSNIELRLREAEAKIERLEKELATSNMTIGFILDENHRLKSKQVSVISETPTNKVQAFQTENLRSTPKRVRQAMQMAKQNSDLEEYLSPVRPAKKSRLSAGEPSSIFFSPTPEKTNRPQQNYLSEVSATGSIIFD
eukprot:TRINITY_DN13357_c0_g1_i1.p1 TRINITY_DN13357_c0_g1~~TRINITY_DN13357_c0_g1_i1.p1  ORF type:complete len:168 (-),score=66.83 TRINITY_DN13357_c0_g1_i1:85-588(-)